jgi:hypothetical protein
MYNWVKDRYLCYLWFVGIIAADTLVGVLGKERVPTLCGFPFDSLVVSFDR